MSRSPALLAAQRAVAIVTMALIATQFFLAGAGAFGATSFDAHKTVGSILVLVVLVGLVVAALARRHAVHAAIVLGVAVLQVVLGAIGEDDAVDRRVPRPQRDRRDGRGGDAPAQGPPPAGRGAGLQTRRGRRIAPPAPGLLVERFAGYARRASA